MTAFFALPVLGLILVFQTAIINRVPLLQGAPDLLMLVILAWAVQERVKTYWRWSLLSGLLMSFISATPLGVYLAGYLLATSVALLIKQWIWKIPLLAMVIATLVGTLISHLLTLLALNVTGTVVPWLQALNLITLPSALLNISLAVPIYAIVRDIAKWVYPEEIIV